MDHTPNTKDLDLDPHQWTTRVDDVEQPKPAEPFWGNGVPFFIVFLLQAAVV